jgi:hypothetical protein
VSQLPSWQPDPLLPGTPQNERGSCGQVPAPRVLVSGGITMEARRPAGGGWSSRRRRLVGAKELLPVARSFRYCLSRRGASSSPSCCRPAGEAPFILPPFLQNKYTSFLSYRMC